MDSGLQLELTSKPLRNGRCAEIVQHGNKDTKSANQFIRSWKVQLSLVHLSSRNIIQYKNIYGNGKLARELRRNQKAYEAWAPQSQINIK